MKKDEIFIKLRQAIYCFWLCNKLIDTEHWDLSNYVYIIYVSLSLSTVTLSIAPLLLSFSLSLSSFSIDFTFPT